MSEPIGSNEHWSFERRCHAERDELISLMRASGWVDPQVIESTADAMVSFAVLMSTEQDRYISPYSFCQFWLKTHSEPMKEPADGVHSE